MCTSTNGCSSMSNPTHVIGHDRVKSLLARGVLSDRSMPAWIFGGPAGVGKCTTATVLAGLVVDPETTQDAIDSFRPLADSRSGTLHQAGTHPDIHLVNKELALESPIREVRERKLRTIPVAVLRQQVIGGVVDSHSFDGPAYVKPYHGHAKVFIIDEAELLGTEAQNLLLKTLEEPPPNTYFILVTTRPDSLLPTIRSRCQMAMFGTLDDEEMGEWIAQTDLEADPDELEWAMRFAEGSPGRVKASIDEGLHAWFESLAPMIDQLMDGRFPDALASEMTRVIEESATAAEKADSSTSKEAAGQRATRLLVSMIGFQLREQLHRSIDDQARCERLAGAVEVLVRAEQQIASNVNRKLALSGLASNLFHALAPAGSAR